MFNFLRKPVGVYISDDSVTLVQLKHDKAVPELAMQSKKDLPKGTVMMGLIQDEASLTQTLAAIQKETKEIECTISLPVTKCYNAVLSFPNEMKDEELLKAMVEKSSSILPVAISELNYQHSILRNVTEGKALVFISGLEKTVIESYKKAFKAAGWKKTHFILESLALERAIPAKLSEYPALMFLHSFGNRTLMSSVFHGHVFDGILSLDLQKDFITSYNSFIQQIGTQPTHIIVSGEKDSLNALAQVNFGTTKPNFVTAEFAVSINENTEKNNKLIIATGLALGEKACKKKSGISLLNLLD